MAEATIPVDVRNPGQVFACLGLMEAAEILCGPAVGGFGEGDATMRFSIIAEGAGNPIRAILEFLASAQAMAVAPERSKLAAKEPGVATRRAAEFPCPEPDTPSALPSVLVGADGRRICVEHWAETPRSGRDNVKFWAGAGGYSGAALMRDALKAVRAGANAVAAAADDPFSVSAQQSSSFRFDWRRDYIPIDAGFSPNRHGAITMVGFPYVEILAAIGLQHARPVRTNARDKLSYRYGVWTAMLPTALARAALGAQDVGFRLRTFHMRLGWPGQEDQARCIIDAYEETAP